MTSTACLAHTDLRTKRAEHVAQARQPEPINQNQATTRHDGSGVDSNCDYGDRQNLELPPYKRMLIPENEMLWRASVAEKLFVRDENEVNQSPKFYHSGPHVCIAFNIGLQQAAVDSERGHDGMQLLSYLCFLVSMVNCANNLPQCVVPTHYTDVVYNVPKKTLSVYWHGNGKYNNFFYGSDDPHGERVREERSGMKPLNLFINMVPVTYKTLRNGVPKFSQTVFAVATIIPAPGVNCLSALEFIAHEHNKKDGPERMQIWTFLKNYVVPPQSEKVGTFSRMVDPTGFDAFSARANEMQIQVQIVDHLTRTHQRDAGVGGIPVKLFDICIMGIAQPDGVRTHKEFDCAYDHFLTRNQEWRTKFAECLEKKRLDCRNLFPFIPRVCMGETGYIRYGWTKGVICMSLEGEQFLDPTLKYMDYGEIKFPASVYASLTRFQNRIDIDPENASFLIERRERQPRDNAVLSCVHLEANADEMTFAHPGALKYFNDEHCLRRDQLRDKVFTVDSLDELMELTCKLQNHDHEFGTHALAMHVQKIITKTFYGSFAVEDSLPVLSHMMDDAISEAGENMGSNFYFWTQDAKRIYELQHGVGSNSKRVTSGVQYWKDIQTFYLRNMNRERMMRPLNLSCFWELLTSVTGSFFGHSATFTAFGFFIVVCDGGGLMETLLPHDKLRRTFALLSKKSTSSGLDTIVCGTFDRLGDAVVTLTTTTKKLRHDLMQLKRNTPGYLMALGRAKFKNTGEVERPDKNVHYANLRATEIRPPSKEYLDGLIIALARDDSSANEILGNTDQNSKGGRAAEQQRNIGGNHIVIAATNVVTKDMEEADRWETLRPITYFMHTPPPQIQDYRSKNRGDLHEDDSNRDTKEFPDNDATKRQAVILRVSSILTGTYIGLMQQMQLISINISTSVNALNSLFRSEMATVFGWARHPCFTASDFSRKHRTCITRAVVDHSIYRLLNSASKKPKFDHAWNDTIYALSVNALEPIETITAFHNAVRQSVDLGLFVLTHHMVSSLSAPILPFRWLQDVVARGGCTAGDADPAFDLNSPNCQKVRDFMQQVGDRNQLLRASNNTGQQSQRKEPYISSPADMDGNSVCSAEQRLEGSSREHIFRVNEVDGNGSIACMARNLTSSMYSFFQDTNVERNSKNLVPMITRHSEKVCDFRALFNMQNVMDVGYFMRLFHGQDEFTALDPCLRVREPPNSNNVTVVGMFNSNPKPVEGKPAFTAYGIHIVPLIVIASLMGPDFTASAMSSVQIASRITEHLLQDVPKAVLYPSGSKVQVKCMLQGDVPLYLNVKSRSFTQEAFCFRRRNGEKIANRPMEQNVTEGEAQLSSPLRPFWYEDTICASYWIPFLKLAHAKVINQWSSEGCIDLHKLHNGDMARPVAAEGDEPPFKLTIQDLILSMASHKLPCDPTLLYGMAYPCVGVGSTFIQEDESMRLLWASVIMHNATTSTLIVCEDGIAANRKITEHATSKIFDVLLEHKLLVLPTVARPAALVYLESQGCFGTLRFDKDTKGCYDPDIARYVCRYFKDGCLQIKHLTALDLMDVLIQERQKLVIHTQALLTLPSIVQLLPVASDNSYMKVKMWYPENESDYEEDHANVLIKRGSSSRSTYMNSVKTKDV